MEAKVDYEGELISALDDLQFEREKNINLQNEVDQLKERIENSDMSHDKPEGSTAGETIERV